MFITCSPLSSSVAVKSQALPSELAQNVKLQNLDLGNNSIMSWAHVKVRNFWL